MSDQGSGFGGGANEQSVAGAKGGASRRHVLGRAPAAALSGFRRVLARHGELDAHRRAALVGLHRLIVESRHGVTLIVPVLAVFLAGREEREERKRTDSSERLSAGRDPAATTGVPFVSLLTRSRTGRPRACQSGTAGRRPGLLGTCSPTP
jgi:hypothetical protein